MVNRTGSRFTLISSELQTILLTPPFYRKTMFFWKPNMRHGKFNTERFNEHTWPISISKVPCRNVSFSGIGHFHRILSRARSRFFLSLRRARPAYIYIYRAPPISFSSSKARSEVAKAFSAEHSYSSPMPLPFFMIQKAPTRMAARGATRTCLALL